MADLKPVYKNAGGSWVKQTAYERQGAEWVLISTRQPVDPIDPPEPSVPPWPEDAASYAGKKCRVHNLVVEAFDADSETPTTYTDIVTSAYKADPSAIGQPVRFTDLGTVFRISDLGYSYYIENGYAAAKKVQFEGASRLVYYPAVPAGGYPRRVTAVFGWNIENGLYRPTFREEQFNSAGTYPASNTSGQYFSGLSARTGNFYATFYVTDGRSVARDPGLLQVAISPDPAFECTDAGWPVAMGFLERVRDDVSLLPMLSLSEY